MMCIFVIGGVIS